MEPIRIIEGTPCPSLRPHGVCLANRTNHEGKWVAQPTVSLPERLERPMRCCWSGAVERPGDLAVLTAAKTNLNVSWIFRVTGSDALGRLRLLVMVAGVARRATAPVHRWSCSDPLLVPSDRCRWQMSGELTFVERSSKVTARGHVGWVHISVERGGGTCDISNCFWRRWLLSWHFR
jgi:hypothetical protein